MTDEMQSIRDDLAFLKALAADDGPFLRVAGLQFLAPGLIYGLGAVFAWAILRGYVPLPQAVAGQMGLWPTVIYIPILIALQFIGRRPRPGTASRPMVVAWSGMGLATLSMLAVIFIAGARLHIPGVWQIWTSICFSLWGLAWWVFALLRRNKAWFMVAAGSLMTAIINATLIGTPEEILGCGVGILLWLGGPGLVITLRGAPRA